MLDGMTRSVVTSAAAEFFGEVQTPIIWIAGIGIALLVAGWAISKTRSRGGRSKKRKR